MMYPTKVYRGYPWYLDELLTRPYNFKHQHVKQKTERERKRTCDAQLFTKPKASESVIVIHHGLNPYISW